MNNTMQYKGYVGSVEFSEADGLFFGKVLGIRALISYEGTNAAELVADFHGAVDDYLSLCEAENSEPEKAYKGSFNIRVSPELHKQAAICAMAQQVSLNTLVEDALREYVAERKKLYNKSMALTNHTVSAIFISRYLSKPVLRFRCVCSGSPFSMNRSMSTFFFS